MSRVDRKLYDDLNQRLKILSTEHRQTVDGNNSMVRSLNEINRTFKATIDQLASLRAHKGLIPEDDETISAMIEKFHAMEKYFIRKLSEVRRLEP